MRPSASPFAALARTFALALAAALVLPGCRRADTPAAPAAPAPGGTAPLTAVTLLLNWFPEAEHGGFFTALADGLYAAEGLDVTILPGGPGAAVVPRIATGAADFGVENADHIVLARAQQAAVVAVLAPIQTHPRCIMVHAESGITNLLDLADLTLAMNPGGAFAHYLRHHAPLPGVRIVPFAGNVSQFLLDGNVAQQGYAFSEPFLARQGGANPRALLLADIGFNPYTSCLVASDATCANRPDLVRRMVRASALGWSRYLESPASAHARIHTLNPEMAPALLTFAWEALKPLAQTADTASAGLGSMRLARWQELCRQLHEIALTDNLVPAASCFRPDFLTP